MLGFLPGLRTNLVWIGLVASMLACDGSTQSPNVILISIDTLRADVLEAYGYDRSTSPRLSAFAEESYVFRNAFAHSPNTIVSHASMLTGLYPAAHGTRTDRALAEDHVTLAEALGDVGYLTAGFTTHADWLTPEKGFAQGFDHFESEYRDAPANSAAALSWLDSWATNWAQIAGRPLFVFFHYYDVHSDWKDFPYESDPRFAELFEEKAVGDFVGCRDELCASRLLRRANVEREMLSEAEVEWVRGLYDAGVATMDGEIGALFDALDRRGLLENSWVVITSDHGEEFREHGRMLHSQAYRETAQIPLIIRPPGGRERRDLETPVGLVDLLPTLLEILGGSPQPQVDGRSLVPVMQGLPVAERLLDFDFYHQPANLAVRNARFSLIARVADGGEGTDVDFELYDVEHDPDERENVASRFPAIVKTLYSEALALRARNATSLPDTGEFLDAVEISEAEENRLRALGYLD